MSYVQENQQHTTSAGPILKDKRINNLGREMNVIKLVVNCLLGTDLHYRKFIKKKMLF
jgi:hypothetical protein